MGYQPYAGAPMAAAMEPPEAQTIRSMLHIARIIALIFAIIYFIGGLAYTAFLFAVGLGFLAFFPILLIIWGVVDIVIYLQLKEIETMVNQRQYEAAKSKSLVWMIIGFILGGIIVGILVLIAYLKFDPLISWSRSQAGGAPAYAAPPMAAPMAPPPGTMGPPPAAMGAPAPAAGQKFCSSCGSPNAAGAKFCAKCGAPLPP